MDKVKITSRLLVATYAVARQLARSLDASLHSEWGEFLAFFSEEDITVHEKVLRRLSTLSPDSTTTGPAEDLIEPPWPKSTWFRFMFWVSGRASFSIAELAYFAAAIKEGMALLNSKERPGDSGIVETRLRLSACEAVISQRMSEKALRRANLVDHFNSSLYKKHESLGLLVSLEDLDS